MPGILYCPLVSVDIVVPVWWGVLLKKVLENVSTLLFYVLSYPDTNLLYFLGQVQEHPSAPVLQRATITVQQGKTA